MAKKTVAGIKIQTKKARIYTHHFADEKYTGPEPAWDTARALEMSDYDFDHHMRRSLHYYNYFFSQKDLKKFVIEWLMENTKMTKKQIATYKQSPDSNTPPTLCGIVRAARVGMPLKEKHVEYIIATVNRIIAETDYEEPVVAKKGAKAAEQYRPTIQDRLNEKVAGIIGELEGEVDLIYANKPTTLKVFDYLTLNKVAQASVGKIVAVVQGHIAELTEADTGKDAQLKEAYAHIKKKDVKRILSALKLMLDDLDAYIQHKKTTKKVRAVKAPDKNKLVSKMKYLVEDKTLKIASVSPLSVLGATTLWVYSIRTRKLGVYYADAHCGTLGVKGTSIIGFDKAKSVAKTLRKPEAQLKEFFKASKVQLRTFVTNIKAVEVKLTGRIGADVLLLKVA